MSDFEKVNFNAGEFLFKAGDQAENLYIVQSGSVEMLNENTGVSFATLGEGESFGEQAILAGGIRGASVKAKEDVVCLVITAEALKSLLAKQAPMMTPVFEALLLQQSMHNHLRLR